MRRLLLFFKPDVDGDRLVSTLSWLVACTLSKVFIFRFGSVNTLSSPLELANGIRNHYFAYSYRVACAI